MQHPDTASIVTGLPYYVCEARDGVFVPVRGFSNFEIAKIEARLRSGLGMTIGVATSDATLRESRSLLAWYKDGMELPVPRARIARPQNRGLSRRMRLVGLVCGAALLGAGLAIALLRIV
ncbi:hypothetical protein [Radicibacter daui]|uniref:hypothetical protein n=1 Tax=Radicibacter daui TaxID=3064829 RepID=UPI0040468FC4